MFMGNPLQSMNDACRTVNHVNSKCILALMKCSVVCIVQQACAPFPGTIISRSISPHVLSLCMEHAEPYWNPLEFDTMF